MFKVKLTARAKKDLRRISKIYKNAVALSIEEIKEDPLIGKSLTRELVNRYSYRVGVYRIIYKISDKDKVVTILSAGHRATVYN